MDILVLVKRVPDTAAKLTIEGGGKSIDSSGVEWVMSPYDEMALEKALQISEAEGGEVTVLTLGPKAATKELRTALAMGAHRAVLLLDEAPFRDAYATAACLATAAQEIPHDLVLAGWKAVDTDAAAVPHYVAARLGLPCITFAVELEVADGRVRVRREVEGAAEVVTASLPAVVTAQKGLAEPRYTSMKGIMMARKKPLEEREAGAPDPKVEIVEMALPPARKAGRIVGEGAEAVPELVRLLSEEQNLI